MKSISQKVSVYTLKARIKLISHVEHGITLKSPRAPLVNIRNKDEPVWIPAELCKVLPGQDARKLLSPNQTRVMIEFAARQPAQNAQSIVGPGLNVTGVKPIEQTLNTLLVRTEILHLCYDMLTNL